MTSDEQALMSAILADPADDTPRLQLADWLEEQGGADRAAFIRLQIEHHPKSEFSLGVNNVYSSQSRFEPNDYEWRDGDPYPILVGREPEPFELAGRAAMFRHWMLFGLHSKVTYRRGLVAEVHTTLQAWMGGQCTRCAGSKSVGVYDEDAVHCLIPCGDCNGTGTIPGHGPAIVSRHPVERVVTEKRPTLNGTAWAMYRGDERRTENSWEIPAAIFKLMPRGANDGPLWRNFPSEQAARDALECHALIVWAKQQSAQTPTG